VEGWLAFWTTFAAVTLGPAILGGAGLAVWAWHSGRNAFAVAALALLGAIIGLLAGLIVAPYVFMKFFAG